MLQSLTFPLSEHNMPLYTVLVHSFLVVVDVDSEILS